VYAFVFFSVDTSKPEDHLSFERSSTITNSNTQYTYTYIYITKPWLVERRIPPEVAATFVDKATNQRAGNPQKRREW
jgi:hypothetical protein